MSSPVVADDRVTTGGKQRCNAVDKWRALEGFAMLVGDVGGNWKRLMYILLAPSRNL